MLQAVQLPAGVADLDTGLANMDGEALTHLESEKCNKTCEKENESKQGARATVCTLLKIVGTGGELVRGGKSFV